VDRFDSLIWFRHVQSQIDKLPDCALRELLLKDIQSYLNDGTTFVDKSNISKIEELSNNNSQLLIERTDLSNKIGILTEKLKVPPPVKEIIKIRYQQKLIWIPDFVREHKGLVLIILVIVCMVLRWVMFPN